MGAVTNCHPGRKCKFAERRFGVTHFARVGRPAPCNFLAVDRGKGSTPGNRGGPILGPTAVSQLPGRKSQVAGKSDLLLLSAAAALEHNPQMTASTVAWVLPRRPRRHNDTRPAIPGTCMKRPQPSEKSNIETRNAERRPAWVLRQTGLHGVAKPTADRIRGPGWQGVRGNHGRRPLSPIHWRILPANLRLRPLGGRRFAR